jgi:hypothetical protein
MREKVEPSFLVFDINAAMSYRPQICSLLDVTYFALLERAYGGLVKSLPQNGIDHVNKLPCGIS